MEMEFWPKGIKTILISYYLHFECGPFPDIDVKLFDKGHFIWKVEVLWPRDNIFDLLCGYLDGLIIWVYKLVVETWLGKVDCWDRLLLRLLPFLSIIIIEKYLIRLILLIW